MRLSAIIPSYRDPCLQKTIDDIRNKSVGEIEIIAVIDNDDEMVSGATVIRTDNAIGMREKINVGVRHSQGKYLMKCDAHCIFDEGFDEKILSNIKDNWIVVPRRYKLDTDKWEIMGDKPIDYERLVINQPQKIGGLEWKTRRRERKNILIDETMVFQGSCWFMSKKHWEWLGELQTKGYGRFTQEAVELALKTWLGGGKVMVNKNTWYAHKHRKFGRTGGITRKEIEEGNKYSQDYWLNNRWENRIHDLDWLMKRFGL